MRTLALCALFLAACSFADGASISVENRCAADSDCLEAACNLEIGMCVSLGNAPLRIGLQIAPSGEILGGTPPRYTVPPFDLRPEADMAIALPPPVKVFGTVKLAGSEVQANVTFVRPDALPGFPPVLLETSTVESRPAFDGMPANFGVTVVPDQDYLVLVEPTGEHIRDIPPRYWGVNVPSGGDAARVDFEYPEEMPTVDGLVLTDTDAPVDGLNVRAIDPETKRVVSSVAVTGESGESGTFRLVIDPAADRYVFRIDGGMDRPLFPTILADPAYLWPDERGVAHVLVPIQSSVPYRGAVERSSVAGESVKGAVITFRASELLDPSTGIAGSFRVTKTADENGEFAMDLLPGAYEVVITPPPGEEDIGVHVDEVHGIEYRGDGVIQGMAFLLPDRVRLHGNVTTSDDREMPGATVHAQALGRLPAEDSPPNLAAFHNRSNSTVTDPNGLFNLPLDTGVYDLVIKPPSESGFSWLVRPNTVVNPEAEPLDYESTAPVALQGNLTLIGTGTALAGAEIRAFAIIEDGDIYRTVEIARTTANEDGTYLLLLPAAL